MTSYQERKRRQPQRTIQNEQVGFKVVGLPWRTGKVSIVEVPADNGAVTFGFVHEGWPVGVKLAHQDRLPREFFLHQLMAVETDNRNELFRFVQTWGFPYHPMRIDDFLLSNFELIPGTAQIRESSDPTIQEARSSIRLTDTLRKSIQAGGPDDVISEEEARVTLELLKSISAEIQLAIEKSEPLEDRTIRILNTATCSEKVITPANGSLHLDVQRLGLTNGIVNQIVDTISDPADWYFCDSSNCGRLFKRKQCATRHPASDSIYCSNTCKNYAVTNDRRKRIDHGR